MRTQGAGGRVKDNILSMPGKGVGKHSEYECYTNTTSSLLLVGKVQEAMFCTRPKAKSRIWLTVGKKGRISKKVTPLRPRHKQLTSLTENPLPSNREFPLLSLPLPHKIRQASTELQATQLTTAEETRAWEEILHVECMHTGRLKAKGGEEIFRKTLQHPAPTPSTRSHQRNLKPLVH